jgi:hypothetical protein
MDLATLQLDPNIAREKFLDYRRSVRARHDAEDAQIMRGYQALSQGKIVIDLVATIRKGGGHLQGPRRKWLPRLAVMRADQRWCQVRTFQDGAVAYHHEGWPTSRERRNVVMLPPGTLPPPVGETHQLAWWKDHQAMVPPVPPGLRPADSLGNYHVLWEAEWQPVPPKDPALLKHIGGDLYVVCATWDLTDLERTVLAGRFR